MNDNLGIAWFDDPDSPVTGWCCFDDTVERFESSGSLKSNYIWVCNLTFFQYKQGGFSSVTNMRPSEYFRTSLSLIAEDLHIPVSLPASHFLPKLLNIFKHLTKYGSVHFGAGLPPYRYYQGFSYNVIPRSIRKPPVGNKGETASFLSKIFKSSTQVNQGNIGSGIPSGAKIARFYFPKASYFKWLLSNAVPVSNLWKEVKLEKPIVIGGTPNNKAPDHAKGIKRLRSLAQSGKVGFCEVSVHSTDPSMTSFYTFGHEGVMRPSVREWAAIEEVIEIASFSTIEVSRIYCSDAGNLELKDSLKRTVDYIASLGYFRENLYKALSDKSSYGATALGAYLSMYDRLACGRAAAAFYNEGFTVASFGNGFVSLYLRGMESSDYKEVLDAYTLGLKLNLVPTSPVLSAIPEEHQKDDSFDPVYTPFKEQIPEVDEALQESIMPSLVDKTPSDNIFELISELESAAWTSDPEQRKKAITHLLEDLL